MLMCPFQTSPVSVEWTDDVLSFFPLENADGQGLGHGMHQPLSYRGTCSHAVKGETWEGRG